MGSGRTVTASAQAKRKNRIALLKEINEARARIGAAPLRQKGGLTLADYAQQRKLVSGSGAAKTQAQVSIAQVQRQGNNFVYGYSNGNSFARVATVSPSNGQFVVRYRRDGSDKPVERTFKDAASANKFARDIAQSFIDRRRAGR